MKKELCTQSKQELIAAIRERYVLSTREQKSRILDEFVRIIGCHRKHAVRLLNSHNRKTLQSRPHGRRVYDEAVKDALIVLWEAADRICGKRLTAILPLLVEAVERKGHLSLDSEVRDRLLCMSASTIDRLLASVRRQAKEKKKRRNAPKKAGKQVPVRTFCDWTEPALGELEIDFVAHCGRRMSGVFIHSLVATDVCSGWTEEIPLLAREQSLAVEGLDVIFAQFPVPVVSINSDNDSAFINETLLGYCKKKNVGFTRARPYQKNDQAWIEQKNGAIIRRFVGYDRYSGLVAGQLLAQIYQAVRLYVNYFQPSFKLLGKTREGSKIKKQYSKPMTPADRLLGHDLVSNDVKDALRNERHELDPIKLLHRIRDLQAALAALASPGNASGPGCGSLDEFISELPRLWLAGEVRPTHRKAQGTTRDWRTRKDPFEKVWFEILQWLADSPDATAKSLFERLRNGHPGRFEAGQLRTLQRRIKEWRHIMAKELVFACRDSVGDDQVLTYR